MPYIPQERREYLKQFPSVVDNPGELNFLLTQVALDYLKKHGMSYATCNDIVGALESAKQEFYAKVVRPYEDSKALSNGEIYPV